MIEKLAPWEVEKEEGDDGGEEDGGEGHLLAVLVLSPAPSCLSPLQRCTVLPAGERLFSNVEIGEYDLKRF